MRILKNILIGFGALFIVLIVIFVYLGLDSREFTEKQAPFVESFMEQFSENWELSSVYSKLTNDLIKKIDSPNGRQALNSFRNFGRFESMSDFVSQSYTTTAAGNKTANFTFKAQFTNGPGLIEIIIIETNEKTLVNGLRITPIGDMPAVNTRHEA